MRDPTYYCVQTIVRRLGRLEPGRESFYGTASEARAAARELRASAAGAVAYAFDGRPEYGIRGEPRVLAIYGDVPEAA